jgi:hypothetical protein
MDASTELILKRQHSIAAIKEFHQEQRNFFLNVVSISKHDTNSVLPHEVLQKRAEHLFVLGLSLSGLASQHNGINTLRALAQLLEEYEYYTATAPVQGMKILRARAATEETAMSIKNVTDPIRPQLYRSGKQVVYEFLQITHIVSKFLLDSRLRLSSRLTWITR